MTIKLKLNIILLVIYLGGVSAALAQNNFDIPDSTLNVPSLQKAIEMAIENSPLLKSADVNTAIRAFELKSAKRDWMNTLGFEAYYKYGSIDNVNVQSYNNITQMTDAQSIDTRYAVGLYLKVPLITIYNAHNRNQTARFEIEKTKYDKLILEDQIRQLVIQQYNRYLLNKQLIGIRSSSYLMTSMQFEKASSDHKNGNLSISELTKIIEAKSKAHAEFVSIVYDFKVSYLLLMELIGYNANTEIIIKEPRPENPSIESPNIE
jgi:outer membrane protein TolC